MADKCKSTTRCQLCAGKHKEEDHTLEQDCQKCKALEDSDGMVIDKIDCTHYLHCTNCSTATHIIEKNHTADARRCPNHLKKYGTAWTNEQKALKTDNPWKVITAKKPRKTKTTKNNQNTAQKIPLEQLACQNQFSIFEDPNPAAHIEEDEHNQ